MSSRCLVYSRAALATVLLITMTVSVYAAGYSNKWRIQCSEGAKSDGQIIFTVTPKGGEPITVTVDIEKGTRENRVAKVICKAFRAQLPRECFKIERDDGEDVLLKKRRGCANFTIKLVKKTVKAVRLNFDHE